MANPISAFLPVEEREDGVYISVTRDLSEKLKLSEILNALEQAGVINYNADLIKSTIERARGGYEKIGEPFEYYRPEMEKYIDIKVTPLKATFTVSSTSVSERIFFTPNILRHCLASKGICCGLKEDVLKKFGAEPAFDTEITAAEGIPPINGEDSKIEFELNVNPDSKPSIGKGGKVDYREIQTFASVKQGQVIAKKTPATQGQPGKSVTGELIPSQAGKDIPLPRGRNTIISNDGDSLIAEKTGIVFEESKLIHVDELLQIKSDVDFSVGNVKYTGNVMIRGGVKPGFVVEAEGDIEISGEVESARVISRNGTVTIHHGVIGKGDTYIYGKNGVVIEFAQNAELRTDGLLTVGRSCLHCTVVCNALEMTEHQAGIVGGFIQAYDHVEAINIGNENNVPTKISLVNKEKALAEDKLKELTVLKDKIVKQLAPVLREVKAKSAILKKGQVTNISDKQREQLKKMVDSYNSLSVKLKYIEKKIEESTATIEKPMACDGFIRVKDTVYPGVEISLYGIGRKVFQLKMTSKLFKVDKGEMQIEG